MRFRALSRVVSSVRFGVLSGLAVLVLPAAEEAATPAWRGGFDLRLRNEYFDNALTLSDSAVRHEQNYQRYRARAWGSVDVVPSLTVNARLVWESWDWNKDSYKSPYTDGWVWSDGVFDQLNLTWTVPGDVPARIVAGRQDIVLGDGWLVSDATSTDGSRTAFFDALRVTLPLPGTQTTLDFAYIDMEAYNRNRTPVFNDQHKPIVDQEERSAYVQISNKSFTGLTLESYLIYRSEDRVTASGDDGEIGTFGGRAVYEPTPHWLFKGEAAVQWGELNDRDVQAWGFLGQIGWNAKDAANNQLRLSLECLSGDDRSTARNEQFDILWGRYPRWSEIGAMLYSAETRSAQFGNLVRFGPLWSVTPLKPLTVSLEYNALWALENNRSPTSGFFRADGSFRGHLVRNIVRYKINRHLTATSLAELYEPGDYYSVARQDTALFWRLELTFAY